MTNKIPAKNPSQMDLAYIAGFFDGEGCVTSRKQPKQKYHYVKVNISQKDPAILLWIQEFYGGRIRAQHRKRPDRVWTTHQLVLSGKDKVERFLRDVLPLTRGKSTQITVALELMKEKGTNHEYLAQRLKELKHE